MVSIEIEEFEGYDLNEFNDFLLAQKTDEFEINFPKEGILFFSPHNELAWEFAIGAYVGQKLSEISSTFEYNSAPLANPGEFSFRIKTQKFNELADLLYLLSGGFGNSEISEPIDLDSEVAHFIQTAGQMEIVCEDLLETYHEYYSDDNVEDYTED